MFGRIVRELREHSPFTLFGAMLGVVFMMLVKKVPEGLAYNIFYVLHPGHVFFSAFVTTALYCRYTPSARHDLRSHWWRILLIGYLGAVGVGTLSDSIIPFWGERLLEMPHAEHHIGFIEEWWLVNPMALVGIVIAYIKPSTRFPHAMHVLLSTWASLFHMLMAADQIAPAAYFAVFLFLFLAVWVPCCFSDIVFPLFFTKGKEIGSCSCCGHG